MMGTKPDTTDLVPAWLNERLQPEPAVPPAVIHLELVSRPGYSVPQNERLSQLLKIADRLCGFRCKRVEPDQDGQDEN
jgi:hypothetical protein